LTNDPLQGKNYDKPKGNQVFGNSEVVQSVGDLIPLENWKAFILGKNKDSGTPDPGYFYLALSDARVFNPGDRILIDCENNTSALRVVRKVEGRIVLLQDKLNHLPKIGGDVFKIIGQKSTQIDTRFDLGKDPDAYNRYLQRMNTQVRRR